MAQPIYPWLRYNENTNTMTCNLCLRSIQRNTFTFGNKNFKTSSLKDHIKSSDHQTAMIVHSLQENLKKSQDKQQSGKDSTVKIALKTMYWMAKEGIA